jgi:hypothetical protein
MINVSDDGDVSDVFSVHEKRMKNPPWLSAAAYI